jgi:hypothetical protein
MPNAIRVHCYCSEDNLRTVKWPKFLAVRPLIGDYVSSLDGRHSRSIVRIEHIASAAIATLPALSDVPTGESVSILGIELARRS